MYVPPKQPPIVREKSEPVFNLVIEEFIGLNIALKQENIRDRHAEIATLLVSAIEYLDELVDPRLSGLVLFGLNNIEEIRRQAAKKRAAKQMNN